MSKSKRFNISDDDLHNFFVANNDLLSSYNSIHEDVILLYFFLDHRYEFDCNLVFSCVENLSFRLFDNSNLFFSRISDVNKIYSSMLGQDRLTDEFLKMNIGGSNNG